MQKTRLSPLIPQSCDHTSDIPAEALLESTLGSESSSLESVLLTAELGRRPSRPPNYEAENRALVILAREMASSPQGILRKLAETALELCCAQSAGISLLESDGRHFHWPAITGKWAAHTGGGTPREFGPCGTVLDRNGPQLMSHVERHFDYFLPVKPWIEEVLLIPFYVQGNAVGTIWVIMHDKSRCFDAEDLRVMTNLGTFAAAACQTLQSTDVATKSEARYRTLFDLGPVAVYSCNSSGVIREYNQQAALLWGRKPEPGDTDERFCGSFKMHRPDGSLMPHDQCPMADVLAGKTPGVRDGEVIVERPDGSQVTVIVNIAPLTDAAGEITGAINCFYDVTERKRVEQAKAKLAAIVESSEDAIITKDLEGIITSWNRGAERLFGYTAQETIGQSVKMLIPLNRLDEEPVILERIRHGQPTEHYETVRRRKDNTLLEISLTVSPLFNAQGQIVGASKIARDITRRKRAEELLRESQEQTKAELADAKLLQAISSEMIHEEEIETLYGKIMDAAVAIMRSQFASMQMLYPERGSGGELRLLAFRGFNPEAAKFWEWVAADSESTCGEALRTGERIIASDVTQCAFMAGTEDLATYLATGIRGVQSAPLRSRNGQLVGMISTHWAHPHQPSERDLRLLDILARQAADLIERKGAEDKLRRSEQHLEQLVNERTSALRETIHELEAFSYSIAHDMRAPLRGMQGFARILLDEHSGQLDADARSYLDRIARSSSRMDALIQDVLNYTRVLRGDASLTVTDLDRLVRDIATTYEDWLPPRAEIRIEGALPPVLGNEAFLTQCVSNLISNGLKFATPDTTPRVRIWAEAPDSQVRLYFEDNGIGIAPKDYARVFRMFERINPASEFEGTGIGLTIARKAAERMGGQIGFESEPGKGSKFWVQLRAALSTQTTSNPPIQ